MPIKINKEVKTFTFRDGQEITLEEPSLLQISAAQAKSKDELEVIKSLLIDMSEGELAKADIEALPFNEFVRLSECVKDFIGIKESD